MITAHASALSTDFPLVSPSFLADVLHGLGKFQKELPCKYFYDEKGAELFDRITELEEYYLTSIETRIMERHAGEMARLLGSGSLLIEYGSGSSQKTRLLLDSLQDPVGYVPIDLCSTQLEQIALVLAREYPHIEILPFCGDFTQSLRLPRPRQAPTRRVVYFPGSTIGNFTPREMTELLRRTRELCGPEGGLLLGADLKKAPNVIEAAYNDREGVTEAFNRNLLVRINCELGADFAVDQFAHRAFYNASAGCIEMHLFSRCRQSVHVGGTEFRFASGESIRTECSYKLSLGELGDRAAAAGFRVERVWHDERRFFSVLYLE